MGDSVPVLQAKLEAVEAALRAHPFESEQVKNAYAIVDARKGDDKAEIQRELAENGLPSLAALGVIQLRGTASWWRLHRKRNSLFRKIERLTD
jgi:hypothetical protein